MWGRRKNVWRNGVYIWCGQRKATKEHVNVVRVFSKAFPDYPPRLPRERQEEFHIDGVSGTTSLANAPYLLASSSKLKELRIFIDNLWECIAY